MPRCGVLASGEDSDNRCSSDDEVSEEPGATYHLPESVEWSKGAANLASGGNNGA